MTRLKPLGLRDRATLAFGLVGLFSAVVLALATFFVARSYLLDQRERSAQQQAFANARLTRSALRANSTDVTPLLTTIRGDSGSDVILRLSQSWYASSVALGEDDIPADLLQVIDEGDAGRHVGRSPSGGIRLVVGTPLAAVDGAYFEVFDLDELQRTLDVLRNVLLTGAIATSVVAAVLGRYAAGRIVDPLGPVTEAAARIADGDLATRLPEHRDQDLAPLTAGFNSMASSLQGRIERDARFAADVSHELRTPLAAMRATINLMERRRAGIPEDVDTLLDALAERVATFEDLVLDLLEISRFDAAAVTLQPEPVDPHEFARQVLKLNAAEGAALEVGTDLPAQIVVDRRRLAQALGTIIHNAEAYAGGLTQLRLEGGADHIRFLLDDAGPGIDPTERAAVLERFARGEAGRKAGAASGTGLGLALSRAQVELHGGTLSVGEAPGGGARFVIEIPVEGP